MSIRRFNGSAWQDVEHVRKFNGTSWQDCEFVRRFDGANWVDVWSGAKWDIDRGLWVPGQYVQLSPPTNGYANAYSKGWTVTLPARTFLTTKIQMVEATACFLTIQFTSTDGNVSGSIGGFGSETDTPNTILSRRQFWEHANVYNVRLWASTVVDEDEGRYWPACNVRFLGVYDDNNNLLVGPNGC